MKATLIEVALTTRSAVSVAAPERAVVKGEADLPVARDGWDQPVVPASGLLGSLRAAAQAQDPEMAARLFGSGLGSDDDSESTGSPSLVRALGTSLRLPDAPLQVRTQTAIDRTRGAAADRMLRGREHLPTGTQVHLYLALDDASAADEADLRELIDHWRPVIGGGRSTGFGRAQVSSARMLVLDLDQQQDLTRWLAASGPESFGEGPGWQAMQVAASDGAPRGRMTLEVDLVTTSDLRVGTGESQQTSADRRAAALFRQDALPAVPGSSWKGLLRSRSEFVLRSLEVHVCDSTSRTGTCGCCPTCHLFGWIGQAGDAGAVAARALLTVHDSVVRAPDGSPPAEQVRDHVSIDRFTGGARRGALYSEQVVLPGAHLTLRVDVPEAAADWALPLLWAVLADVHEGFVGLGHGTTRGMGFVELRQPQQLDGWRERLRDALPSMPALPGGAHA